MDIPTNLSEFVTVLAQLRFKFRCWRRTFPSSDQGIHPPIIVSKPWEPFEIVVETLGAKHGN
jgi:hypothetical protein